MKTTDPAILIARIQRKRDTANAWYAKKKKTVPGFKGNKPAPDTDDRLAMIEAMAMIAAANTRRASRQAELDARRNAREAKQNRLMKLAAKMKQGACK